MIRKGTCVIAGVVVLIATGCGSGTKSGASGSMTVNLGEQNASGESGTARLTAQGDKTKVVLDLRNPSATMASETQPAHIHKGTCAKLDPTPAYPLKNIVNGKSVTTVDVPLTKLLNGKYAVNIHRSAKQLKVYVVCGDITRHSAPTPTDTIGEQDGD